MRQVLRALCAVVVLYCGSLPAQSSEVVTSCVDRKWSPLLDHTLAERGLAVQALKLDAVVLSTQKRDSHERAIRIRITDCPILSHSIRTIKLFDAIDFGFEKKPDTYAIYITAAVVRETSAEDIARIVRKQVCTIRSGLIEIRRRAVEDLRVDEVRLCMYEEAVAEGDMEYAKWLARTSNRVAPRMGRSLSDMPFSIPHGLFESLGGGRR